MAKQTFSRFVFFSKVLLISNSSETNKKAQLLRESARNPVSIFIRDKRTPHEKRMTLVLVYLAKQMTRNEKKRNSPQISLPGDKAFKGTRGNSEQGCHTPRESCIWVRSATNMNELLHTDYNVVVSIFCCGAIGNPSQLPIFRVADGVKFFSLTTSASIPPLDH